MRRTTAVAPRVATPPAQATDHDRVGRHARVLVTHAWGIGLVALVVAVALHLGALDWYTDVPLSSSDGSSERLPNTFASIDHPFHINKERAVLDALRDGEFPRWISNHQAGYPAEFYPLGADLLVVAAWTAGFGFVPVEVVHKLVVIGILFIPVAAYWAIARRDGWPASVAVTAALLHLFVPGSWLGGGPDELLRMGMWPNVFAIYLTLPLMLWTVDYLRFDSRRGFALAALVASLAIYSNPRALIAVAIVMLAVGIVTLAERPASRTTVGQVGLRRVVWLARHSPIGRRSLVLGTTIVALCSALILPLRARQHLYEFTRFVEFSSLAKVWEYCSGAIPLELVVIAVIGAIIASREPGFHTRVLALWLPLSAILIIAIGWTLRDLPALEQLEAPRLLPLVRLPAPFLAAIGFHWLVQCLLRLVTTRDVARATGIGALILVAAFVLTPISTLSANERGLPAIKTTNQPAFNAIARSAQVYERNASPEDRALIVGSPISEHASFWIPALTNASAFHSAWIWYWHTPSYADQTMIADTPSALDLDFLNRNGLTMVMIESGDDETLALANSKPYLGAIDPGTPGGYALFRVDDNDPSTRGPVTVENGEVTAIDVSREHLRATVHAGKPTEVTIAINDFPAWRATVDGIEKPIRRSADGYMIVSVPAGDSTLTLDYEVEPIVWAGRVLTALGVLLLVTVVSWPILRRRATQ